jgi:hypothetical protein
MNIGRMRRMHPLIALQAFIGPVFFHLLSRPILEHFTEFPMTPQEAVGDLMTVIVAGSTGRCSRSRKLLMTMPDTAPAVAATAPATAAPAIEARTLTKKFGDLVAVDALDLELARGRIYGLLDPTDRARPR